MAACAMVTGAVLMMPSAFADGPRLVVDTFTATTANMTPAGLNLRIQILEWQEADARAEVVATLAAGADAATPLGKLPTVGYVWPSGSPVGYSLKYAHREAQADGSERITLVTDKRLGSFDFKGWSVASPAVSNEEPYSVIELYLNGSGAGTGTLSLVADVVLDETNGTVALQHGAGAPGLLASVQRAASAR
ncbi:MAG TPA: hypothetical protein VIQ99_10260 [Gammaproteobacteria bacterium]